MTIFNHNRDERKWKCSTAERFLCENLAATSRHLGTTAYSVPMLVPAVSSLFALNDKAKPETVRAELGKFCLRSLSDTFVRRVSSACKAILYFAEIKDVRLMPVVIAALRKHGWKATMSTLKPPAMQYELDYIWKARHREAQKHLPVKERTRFCKKSVPKVEQGVLYVNAYSLVPPNTKENHALCHPFSGADFTHCNGGAHVEGGAGVMGSRYALSPNRNLVDLVHMRSIANEDALAWGNLNRITLENIPAFYSKAQCDATDGCKGAKSAWDDLFKGPDSPLHFRDYKHRLENLCKTDKKAAEWYKKAFFATTALELENIKDEMPSKVALLLGKIPDASQYPIASGGLRGRMGSSFVESGNNAIMAVRKAAFVQSLFLLAQNIKKRHDEVGVSARAETERLPMRVREEMFEKVQLAAGIPADLVKMSQNRKTAVVNTTKRASESVRVEFASIKNSDNRACDKGCSVHFGYPCEHQIAAAAKAGFDIAHFMHPADTSEQMKLLYEKEITLPTTADFKAFSNLRNNKLRLPPETRRKAGRPRENRHLGCLEKTPAGNKKKRVMTCHICFEKGHNRGNCPKKRKT